MIFVAAIILTVGTYAWFIGTSSVKTSDFTIKVSSDETFELSLNGSDWVNELTIDRELLLGTKSSLGSGEHNAYTGNTNHWADGEGTGMLPVSTSGQIDSDVSRLKMYEKSSITATSGGYRIITSQIDNYSSVGSAVHDEGDTYITFDLFIKNGSNPQYYTTTYNASDDEALYLTRDSRVVVSSMGSGEDYGIANSIRVAFAQIGRVASNKAANTITSISCSTVGDVTGLCSNVTPTIWEPNDTNHNKYLIDYFYSVCKNRTGATSYSDTVCSGLNYNEQNTSYVVKGLISSTNNIDVYDGINTYTPNATYLTAYDTFTDTEKKLTEQSRPAFMYIAPNSVTKIRVYVYLEGQDIDNYDLISRGQSVDVSFGFTKDKFDTAIGTDSTNDFSTETTLEKALSCLSQINGINSCNYDKDTIVGKTRTITLGTYGTHTIRVANISTPAECSTTGFSQTACGIVLEFADIITEEQFNETDTNVGGYPKSQLYKFLNNKLYNLLPNEIKDVIITTSAVSGHGSSDSSNITSTEKLYLLSEKEVYNSSEYDSAASLSRQLDYYSNKSVTSSSYADAIKKYSNIDTSWWLRPAISIIPSSFLFVGTKGGLINSGASNTFGISPAFRIG